MENEQMNSEMPSYWNSVLIGGLTVAVIMSVFGLVSQYMMIGSEPSGSPFNMSQAIGSISCLFGAIGGFIATRHYAKTFDVKFKLGKGAVIGLLTGVIGVLISTVINLIWTYLIDTGLNQAVYDWSIANLEAMNLPQEQYEMQKSFIPEPGSTTALLIAVGIGLAMMSVLNLISGLIGAKVFASEEEQY
jgi:hypothetical protein